MCRAASCDEGVVKITDALEDCKVGALGSKRRCDIGSQCLQTAFSFFACSVCLVCFLAHL